jgi:hypothetical protein
MKLESLLVKGGTTTLKARCGGFRSGLFDGCSNGIQLDKKLPCPGV